MSNVGVARAEGMPDFWGDRALLRYWAQSELLRHFQGCGYELLEVPIVEQTELYLRKSGEDIVAQMYDFEYQNHRLCLRPEMTASVIRSYIEHFPSGSWQRFCYSGAVFRYEKSSNHNYRQFTQIGVELIGSSSLIADAEVIYTACAGLRQLGINNFQLVIGHIGVLITFLRQLNLHDRLISILLASMELLHQENGRTELEKQLQMNYLTPKVEGKLASILADMNEETAQAAVLEMLANLKIAVNGNRDPQEIVGRLVAKMKQPDQTVAVQKAIDFMSHLVKLEGAPYEVLIKGRELLQEYKIDLQPLTDLEKMIELLEVFNSVLNLPSNLRIDLGLTRGLQYYTGTIFELLDQQGRHLGGGGRYDDLVYTLGGDRSTPATGFSLSLDKLCNCIEGHSNILPLVSINCGLDSLPSCLQLSNRLRELNLRVQLVWEEQTNQNCWQVTTIGDRWQVYDPHKQQTLSMDEASLINYLQQQV